MTTQPLRLLCASAATLALIVGIVSPAAAAPKKKSAAPEATPAAAPAASAAEPAAAPAPTDDISSQDPGCQKDIATLCAEASPGQDRIANCLRSVKDQIGPECKKSLNAHLGARFPVLCKADIQQRCSAESKQGMGAAFACMKGQTATELTESCRRLFAPPEIKTKAASSGGGGAAAQAPKREKAGNPLQGFFLPPAR